MLGVRQVGLALGLGLAGGACVVSPPSDVGKPGPCGGRACSQYGYCERGTDRCKCERGYAGNPYAGYGCQALSPGGDCSTTCGLNAHCQDGACTCAEGFVAVCGTGDCLAESALCDGVTDCANATDERADVCWETVVMTWSVTDECDDDAPLSWRLWATERAWVWPGPDTSFESRGLGQPSLEAIECLEGEIVCFGASADGRDWGVGAGGVVACEDCCEPCREVTIDYGALACG